jgi:hypothetical protein
MKVDPILLIIISLFVYYVDIYICYFSVKKPRPKISKEGMPNQETLQALDYVSEDFIRKGILSRDEAGKAPKP